MNLHDALRRMPDIQAHLSGITAENAVEFVGKKAERHTPSMIKNQEDPVHTGFYGTKLADGLREADVKLKRYNQAYREKTHEDPAMAERVQTETTALTEDLARKNIAHRLAQAVVLVGSVDLPDVGFKAVDGDRKSPDVPVWEKTVDVGNNIKRRVMDAPPGIRLYWLKVWATLIYEKAVVMRGMAVEA